MTSKLESRTASEAGNGQRLDKWLWFARIARTRTLAARLIETGKARVNRTRVTKPARAVYPGDVVTLVIHGRVKVLKVLGAGTRRGPAAEARDLYEDISPASMPQEQPVARTPPAAQRDKGAGRPTKRDRRRIYAWLSRGDGPASRNE